MRLYVRDGRRDAALRQYQSCVDTLRRELSVEPEAETRQLYQEVLRSRATPSKAARTAMAHLEVLASQVQPPSSPLPDEAPMFGRQSELARLRHALDEALSNLRSISRDTLKSIAFASRAMVADVALPSRFARLRNLRLDTSEDVRIGGWAFRGLLNLPVIWD